MNTVFTHLNYRKLIKAILAGELGPASSMTSAQLAQVMRVQPPYLSRVMKGDADLNADQLFLLCQFCRFSEAETDYVILLLEWARAASAARKQNLRKKIDRLQDERRDSRHHLKAESVSPADAILLQEYYLEPWAPIVHMAMDVPRYQQQPFLLCAILGLTRPRLQEILDRLTKLGLIVFDEGRKAYTLGKGHLQLQKSSLLSETNHQLLRHASVEHLKKLEARDKQQFTVTFSADADTRAKIHDHFNDFLSRVEPLVREAAGAGVYQMNFDLFRWDHEIS